MAESNTQTKLGFLLTSLTKSVNSRPLKDYASKKIDANPGNDTHGCPTPSGYPTHIHTLWTYTYTHICIWTHMKIHRVFYGDSVDTF